MKLARIVLVIAASVSIFGCQDKHDNQAPVAAQLDPGPQTAKVVYVRIDRRTHQAEYAMAENVPQEVDKDKVPAEVANLQWTPIESQSVFAQPGESENPSAASFYFVKDGSSMEPMIDNVVKDSKTVQGEWNSNSNSNLHQYWYGGGGYHGGYYGGYYGYPYHGYYHYYWPGYYYPSYGYGYGYPYPTYSPYYYSSYYYWPNYYYNYNYYYYQPYAYYTPYYGNYNYNCYNRWW